jgi:CheY-like chemotaxis protein
MSQTMSSLKSILLVEDDDISYFITEKVLAKAQICEHFVRVSNGAEGIQYLKELEIKKQPFPDLILLDINMPVMNGFEFLETIKTLPCFNLQNTIISALTSSSSEEEMKKLKDYGILHINKPILQNSLNILLRYLSIRESKNKRTFYFIKEKKK